MILPPQLLTDEVLERFVARDAAARGAPRRPPRATRRAPARRAAARGAVRATGSRPRRRCDGRALRVLRADGAGRARRRFRTVAARPRTSSRRSTATCPIHCAVEIAGDGIRIDFAGTAPQYDGNLNCPLAVTKSACYFVVRCLTEPDLPASGGAFAPVTVTAPEGCLVNAQRAGRRRRRQHRDLVAHRRRRLRGARPSSCPCPRAGQGTMNNLALGNDGFTYYETVGGGQGACPDADGPSGVHVAMSNTLATPAEALELRVSAAGRALGAARSARAAQARTAAATASCASCACSRTAGSRCSPSGGAMHRRAGPAGRTERRGRTLVNGEEQPPKLTRQLHAGDVVRVETPGGGGHGHAGVGSAAWSVRSRSRASRSSLSCSTARRRSTSSRRSPPRLRGRAPSSSSSPRRSCRFTRRPSGRRRSRAGRAQARRRRSRGSRRSRSRSARPPSGASPRRRRSSASGSSTGVNEVDAERPGTIYNSLLYHSPAGELALHHRKLVPTNHERLVWGQGDGRGLEAVETGFGRLGGLICWENYMPLARVALYESGVEIYVASTADDGDAWQADARPHRAREPRVRRRAGALPAASRRTPTTSRSPPRSRESGRSAAAAARSSPPTARTSPGRSTTRRRSSTRSSTRRGCSPSGSASTRSATTAGRTSSSSQFARTVRRRVHVLPQNPPVPEREDVDAVPLLRAGRSRPLAHGEVVAGVERPRREPQRRVVAEDLRDVLAYRAAPSARSSAVWLSKTISGSWSSCDRVEVLRVPGGVVALDQVANSRLRPSRRSVVSIRAWRRSRASTTSTATRSAPTPTRRSRRMREDDPVFCQPGIDGETPIWWVTRYEDAEAVLLDDERFVRDPRLALPPEQPPSRRLPESSPSSTATCSTATATTTGACAASSRRRSRRGWSSGCGRGSRRSPTS